MIRDGFKKRDETQDDKTMIQVRVPTDLLAAVDAQIKRDHKKGLLVDRTIVITECLKNYLKESGKSYPQRRGA